jgi:hypothetical protein
MRQVTKQRLKDGDRSSRDTTITSLSMKVGPAGEVAEQLEGEPNPATATVEVDGGHDQADEA